MSASRSVKSLVTDRIDLWASAIKRKSGAGRGSSSKIELYGIKKLRELILDLAVRGLLVPQDPKDEPANNPPKSIVSKKPKPNLPVKWNWICIGDLGDVLDSMRKPITKKDRVSGSFPYYGASGVVDYISSFIFDEPLVLIGEDGAKWSKGESTAYMIAGKTWVNNHAHVLRPNRKIVLDLYLIYFFMATDLNEYITGMTVPKLNQARLISIPVPVPPLDEQHRIVAKVEELMTICDQLEQQTEANLGAHQTLVETLLRALTSTADHAQFSVSWRSIAENFDTLFTTEESIDRLKQVMLFLAADGALVKFPENSKKVPLKKILSFGPRNGFSPKESPVETGKKVLKLGATSYGQLDLSQSKAFGEDVPPTSHLWLKKGDILVQRGNSHFFVGSNVHIEKDAEGYIYPDLMMKLRVNDEALPEFISLFLSSPQGREHMWEGMTGTSGTMPKISKSVVENIPVIVPPIKIQEMVISKIKSLFEICSNLKSRLNDIQTTQLHLADTLAEQALARA